MKRMAFILCAVLLLCGCSKQDDELKIVSFNIRYNSWNNIDGENGWPNRKAAVVRMINEERPAALGLQEALVDQLLYLDSCLPQYRRIGVGRDDGKEAGEFMAIYYDTTRLDLLKCGTHWLSETPEVPSKGWDAACYRTVTSARFRDRKNRKVFVYLNTHLDHVGQTARAESAKMIARMEGDNECLGAPVILGGDMNSTIDDTIFRSFYAVGLRDARELTDSTSNAITYNAFGGLDQSGNGTDGKVIDHFFVRDVQVLCFRTLDGDYGVPFISDHYPIEITVKL
jgi:endonuclease/exonuclease/phosphatase family metal-dependent hydrolase